MSERRSGLTREAPLGPGVSNAETFSLGVALRATARRGADHGNVASVIVRVLQTILKQSALQAQPSKFRDGSPTGKQRNSQVAAEGARGSRRAVDFSDKTGTSLAVR